MCIRDMNESYAKLLAAYERTVEQRNNLLRDGYAPGLLEVCLLYTSRCV